MNKILVVEDDAMLNALYETVLTNHGFKVLTAKNGLEALEIFESHIVTLVITDIMMPDMDGYELSKLIRISNQNIPILMITAKESFPAKKKGFETGIDDYMVKPIDLNEMILRVEALFRRSKIVHEKKIVVGATEFDLNGFTVIHHTTHIELPKKEFFLLYKLIAYPNKLFTRQELMEEIWGLDSNSDERTIDVHIKRIREKFSDNPDFEIVTMRGLGYKVVVYDQKT